MEETRYIIEYSYPSGHEMSYGSYGPGTESDLRTEMAENGISQENIDSLFLGSESEEIYSFETTETLRLVPVRDSVVVVTWSEPEDGISVYGPYTWAEAEAAIPKIKRFFVNPFASAEERDDYLAEATEADGQVFSAEQCGDMDYEWGGVIPDGVIFDIVGLEKP